MFPPPPPRAAKSSPSEPPPAPKKPLERFQAAVCEEEYQVARALVDAIDVCDAEKAGKALLAAVTDAHVMGVLRALLTHEFGNRASHEILRAQSLTSRALGHHARRVGGEYLHASLDECVTALVALPEPLDVDASSALRGDVDANDARYASVAMWLQRFEESITSSAALATMPPSMRELVGTMQQLAEAAQVCCCHACTRASKFAVLAAHAHPHGLARKKSTLPRVRAAGCAHAHLACPRSRPPRHHSRALQMEPSLRSALIGGYLILRFLNPAIIMPEASGLVASAPSAEARGSLKLMAKLLQNAGNGTTPREERLAPLISAVEATSAQLATFFAAAAQPAPCPLPISAGEGGRAPPASPSDGIGGDAVEAADGAVSLARLCIQCAPKLRPLLPPSLADELLDAAAAIVAAADSSRGAAAAAVRRQTTASEYLVRGGVVVTEPNEARAPAAAPAVTRVRRSFSFEGRARAASAVVSAAASAARAVAARALGSALAGAEHSAADGPDAAAGTRPTPRPARRVVSFERQRRRQQAALAAPPPASARSIGERRSSGMLSLRRISLTGSLGRPATARSMGAAPQGMPAFDRPSAHTLATSHSAEIGHV